MDTLRRFALDERGQDLVEYSLLLVFIAMAAIYLIESSAGSINPIWASGSTTLASAATRAN